MKPDRCSNRAWRLKYDVFSRQKRGNSLNGLNQVSDKLNDSSYCFTQATFKP